jgi:hypothetical protein
MEPIDTDEDMIGISMPDNPDRTSVTPPNLSVGADPTVAPGADQARERSDEAGGVEAPPDERRENLSSMAVDIPGDRGLSEVNGDPLVGVTSSRAPSNEVEQSQQVSALFDVSTPVRDTHIHVMSATRERRTHRCCAVKTTRARAGGAFLIFERHALPT